MKFVGDKRQCRLGAALNIELFEYMMNVNLDRGFADEQRPGDFLVGQTLGDQTENLLLAVGQRCAAWTLRS